MRITERVAAISVNHPLSMNRKIDQFLSERIPDFMDEYKIADSTDMTGIEGLFEDLEKRMDDLESWKNNFEPRIENNQNRMARIKVKFGVK